MAIPLDTKEISWMTRVMQFMVFVVRETFNSSQNL